MGSSPPRNGRVLAVLGPTNTGKTHFAVERLLAHRSGMIGFPLRLLAREIYDRIVALRGADAVALITGEEKLGSDKAPYIVATVEAMPVDRPVAFLAVDEIQLCADYERGHIFTDRLLHARGLDETMFLGAETIRPILRRLVPEAEIIGRPRFSTLSHAGPCKLTRLPRRSAIVAFSAAEVYTLGELMRRQRGGVAIVLGALSPRTRNAQVAMYQAGEVEHLVATDAIGMGLNMDLAHVAFASLRKFDGRHDRRLSAAELAQIAGRAGRHMADGSFGTTNGAPALDEVTVAAIETHSFPVLKALRWRNSALDFRSLEALTASLDEPPPLPCLIKVRDALDDRSLALLGARPEIRARADSAERVRLLWQVCQIPDFRKTLTDAHLHLLATVYGHLTTGTGMLPTDWVAAMLARLERVDGDVDALVGRIAHVRTWTYLSHRTSWIADAEHWQARAREVEDRLSDALHERLAQRFVDRRTTALMRSLREHGQPVGVVDGGGAVMVDGHHVGELHGLRFQPAAAGDDTGRRVMAAAARRVVGPELARRVAGLVAASDSAFALDEADRIVWDGAPVGCLLRGPELRRPALETLAGEELPERHRAAVRARLRRWLDAWLGRRLAALDRLAVEGPCLAGPGRGVAFSVVEGLGMAAREPLADLLRDLAAPDRAVLTRLGLRFGCQYVYLVDLLKAGAVEARLRLWRIWMGRPAAIPPPGRTVLRSPTGLPEPAALAAGYAALGGVLLRVDVLERLAAALRARARADQAFALPVELAAPAGLTRTELTAVVEALGYRASRPDDAPPRFQRPTASPVAARPASRPHPGRAGALSPFAALAVLRAGR